jgi:hypothetical protein
MKALVYRPKKRHGSWRPRSLVDDRGPCFPEEYNEILVLHARNIDGVLEQYVSVLGDVIFFGEGDDQLAYVAAPFGLELVKFGQQWRSPQ